MVAFNKMFVMLPVMLAARKLDGDDPFVVFWLRVAYVAVQVIMVMIIAYTYVQAMAWKGDRRVVYVPPPPQPFADPNAKRKYTEVIYGDHVMSTIRSLVLSTVFGIILTVGLHLYKGMVIGLAIQSIMAPFNIIENAIVKALLMGSGIQPGIFEEKTPNELTPEDEVVDASGEPIVPKAIKDGSSNTLEELLLDTWDAGNKADVEPLLNRLTSKNCNMATKESGWTPLMVLAGLGAPKTGQALRQLLEIGADPTKVDGEGWNALHWAAFHGSEEAASALKDVADLLKDVQDKEGKTPLDHARTEGNEAVVAVLEGYETKTSNDDNSASAIKGGEDGLRRRK